VKATLDTSAKFHAELSPAFVKLSEADFAKHSALPFSSLEDIAAITEALVAELQALKARENLGDNKLSEIQSRMLKSASRFGPNGHRTLHHCDSLLKRS
jgi:nucleoporin NUP159